MFLEWLALKTPECDSLGSGINGHRNATADHAADLLQNTPPKPNDRALSASIPLIADGKRFNFVSFSDLLFHGIDTAGTSKVDAFSRDGTSRPRYRK
jgi:hypothetical protein